MYHGKQSKEFTKQPEKELILSEVSEILGIYKTTVPLN